MKRFIPFLFLLLFLFPLYGSGSSRPSLERVQEEIQLMGDENYNTRVNAQKQLEAWRESYPRYLFLQMANAYTHVEDIEIEIRLRELLKPLAKRYLHTPPRGYLGVHLGSEKLGGKITVVLIRQVIKDQAAEAAGLQAGDLILLLNGETMDEIGGKEGLSDRIGKTMPGSVLELAIKREDKEFLVRVIVGLRPMSPQERIRAGNDFDAQYIAWLDSLRPDRTYNGMPMGHYPSPPEMDATQP